MSNPKRKVTDLLPSEAILISSGADLKVLDEFEKEGITWSNGEKATQWKHFPMSYCFLRYNEDGEEGLFWLHTKDCEEYGKTIYPATDFIPTESDEVEVLSKAMITINLSLDGNTAFRIGKVLKQHEPEIWELLKQEIRQIELKTRNTPNQ